VTRDERERLRDIQDAIEQAIAHLLAPADED